MMEDYEDIHDRRLRYEMAKTALAALLLALLLMVGPGGCTTVRIDAQSASTVTVDAHKQITVTTDAQLPVGAGL